MIAVIVAMSLFRVADAIECSFDHKALDVYEAVIRYQVDAQNEKQLVECKRWKALAADDNDPTEQEAARSLLDSFCGDSEPREKWVSLDECDPPSTFLHRFAASQLIIHPASPETDPGCRGNYGPIGWVDENQAEVVYVWRCDNLGAGSYKYEVKFEDRTWKVTKEIMRWIT